MRPSIYIETTVPSYYVSTPSRDVVALAHQAITRLWWERRLPSFHAYISPVVLEEARRGDPDQAARRLQALSAFDILETTQEIEHLARRYVRDLGLPPKALRDSAHLAFACAYELDYLVTRNCVHIANGEVIRLLCSVNAVLGIQTPTICTPEELMGREEPSGE